MTNINFLNANVNKASNKTTKENCLNCGKKKAKHTTSKKYKDCLFCHSNNFLRGKFTPQSPLHETTRKSETAVVGTTTEDTQSQDSNLEVKGFGEDIPPISKPSSKSPDTLRGSLSDKIRGDLHFSTYMVSGIPVKDIKQTNRKILERMRDTVCKRCGEIIKYDDYCWERHMDAKHKNIKYKNFSSVDNDWEKWFRDLDRREIEEIIKSEMGKELME